MNHLLRNVPARAAIVGAAAALFTVGCGSTAVHRGSAPAAHTGKPRQLAAVRALTPARVETQIAVLQQRVGLSVQAVHCPRQVRIRDGHSFTCITTLAGGGPVKTTVTPTRADLGDARFQFPLRSVQ